MHVKHDRMLQISVLLGALFIIVTPSASTPESPQRKTVVAPSEAAPVSESSASETSLAPATVAIPEPTTPAAVSAQTRTPEDDWRAKLDGTQWALELTPLAGGEKAKGQKDTVKFEGRKVVSERMTKAGYPDTNYTLTIGEDGVAVWETMQTKEGAGVAFWRGEFHGSAMRGVLSKHPVEGAAEDFSFTARETTGKAVDLSESSAFGAQAASPASSQPSKKRKGR